MTPTDLVILAGSAAVVALMIGVAALLGFRQTARLDEAELGRLAAAEGVRIENAVLDARGRSALALLAGGKVLIARVMADGVSARVAAREAVKLRIAGGRLRIALADLGFAPLSLRFKDEAPDWLRALALAGENN